MSRNFFIGFVDAPSITVIMLLQRTVRCAVVGRCGAVRAASSQVAMIKELRAQTNAPILDCKKALTAEGVDGDFAKAVDYLRAKGIASAMKRSGKAASEGAVGAVVDTVGSSIRGAVVEVRCQNVAQCTRMYSVGQHGQQHPCLPWRRGQPGWKGRVAGLQGRRDVAGLQGRRNGWMAWGSRVVWRGRAWQDGMGDRVARRGRDGGGINGCDGGYGWLHR